MSNPTELPDLDRLEALADAATPGIWEAQRHGVIVAGPMRQYVNGSARSQIANFTNTFHEDDPEDEPCRKDANAAFCAAANPAAVLALIALARRAQPEGEAPQAEPFDLNAVGLPVYLAAQQAAAPGSKAKEAMNLALNALEVATTPLPKDRQTVLAAQAALRAALSSTCAPGTPEAPADMGEPTMLWDADDPEDGTQGDNPQDFAENYVCNSGIDEPVEVEVLCAYRGGKRSMLITPAGYGRKTSWSWVERAAQLDGGQEGSESNG